MILALLLAASAPEPTRDVTCSKPAVMARADMSTHEEKRLMERAQAYVSCMSKRIEAQRTLADEMIEKAKAEAQKSNMMVTEVNAFITAVKTFQDERASK